MSRIKIRWIELSRSYREVSIAKEHRWIEKLSSIYRAYKNFSSMDREAIEIESQNLQWIEIAIIAIERRSSRGLIDSLAIERHREAVKIA